METVGAASVPAPEFVAVTVFAAGTAPPCVAENTSEEVDSAIAGPCAGGFTLSGSIVRLQPAEATRAAASVPLSTVRIRILRRWTRPRRRVWARPRTRARRAGS